MKEVIRGVETMHTRAADFVRALTPNEKATVIGLTGDLGSGKTTFVQGVARALGVTESVTSPTFVIEKIYPLKNQPFKKLVHIDAYRLKNAHELEVLGWRELLGDPSNLIFIEWPENVPDTLPKNAPTLTLHVIDEHARRIEYPESA